MNDDLDKYKQYWENNKDNHKVINITVGDIKLHQETIKAMRESNCFLVEKNRDIEKELTDIKRKYYYDDLKFKILRYSIVLAILLISLCFLVGGIAQLYIAYTIGMKKLSLMKDLGGDGIQAVRDVTSTIFNR